MGWGGGVGLVTHYDAYVLLEKFTTAVYSSLSIFQTKTLLIIVNNYSFKMFKDSLMIP